MTKRLNYIFVVSIELIGSIGGIGGGGATNDESKNFNKNKIESRTPKEKKGKKIGKPKHSNKVWRGKKKTCSSDEKVWKRGEKNKVGT